MYVCGCAAERLRERQQYQNGIWHMIGKSVHDKNTHTKKSQRFENRKSRAMPMRRNFPLRSHHTLTLIGFACDFVVCRQAFVCSSRCFKYSFILNSIWLVRGAHMCFTGWVEICRLYLGWLELCAAFVFSIFSRICFVRSVYIRSMCVVRQFRQYCTSKI